MHEIEKQTLKTPYESYIDIIITAKYLKSALNLETFLLPTCWQLTGDDPTVAHKLATSRQHEDWWI